MGYNVGKYGSRDEGKRPALGRQSERGLVKAGTRGNGEYPGAARLKGNGRGRGGFARYSGGASTCAMSGRVTAQLVVREPSSKKGEGIFLFGGAGNMIEKAQTTWTMSARGEAEILEGERHLWQSVKLREGCETFTLLRRPPTPPTEAPHRPH
jgi:hypothetical protein